MKYEILVACAFGVEAITKQEIIDLGYQPKGAINGRIAVEGTEIDVARLNMFVRTADRVYIRVAKFNCVDFDSLFNEIKSVEWDNFIPKNSQINISAKSTASKLFGLTAIQSITKKAIITKLLNNGQGRLIESLTPIEIEVAIYNDEVSVNINTSGQPLHKRGYRQISVAAPIKETLAAALIYFSKWNYENPLVDLCCGSGTIPIEAALIATNTATGLNKKFDFVNWSGEFTNAYNQTVEYAKSLINHNKFDITGYDIDSNAIDISNKHLKLAGVSGVNFVNKDLRQFETDKTNGTIICNLPYGQRLSDAKEVDKLYIALGAKYRELNNWNLFALTDAATFERCFGKRAAKNRKLFNANLQCYLYYYYGVKQTEYKF